jgi:predicted SAM-dependent methyltransferase
MERLVVKKGSKKILDIGCGPNKYKTDEGEVVGADLRELPGVDYRCDISRLPFATGSYDIVHSSHVLEHFGRNEWEATLDEWIRVLAPKGEFRFCVPNIAWAAKQINKGIVDFDVLNVLYGQQEYGLNFHKVGFTPEIVKSAFEKRGFVTEIQLQGYNIVCRAVRKEFAAKEVTKKARKR